jgi:uncharacterized protein YaaR (DUF327 family)
VRIFESGATNFDAEQPRKAGKGRALRAGGTKAEARAVTAPSFAQALNGQAEGRVRQDLDSLMEQLAEQGERLSKVQTFEEMERFRKIVRDFLGKLVSQLYRLQLSSLPQAQRHKRVNVILEKVDLQMEALARQVLSRQSTGLDILANVDQIRGLLCDLYK